MSKIIEFPEQLQVSTFHVPANLTEEEKEELVHKIMVTVYGEDYEEDDE